MKSSPRFISLPARGLRQRGVERTYEFFALAAVASAHLALLSTSQLHPLHGVIILAALFLSPFRARVNAPPWTWNALLSVILLVSLGSALFPPSNFETYFRAAARFLAYVISVLLFSRSGERDEFLLLLLCLLELAAAAVMTISLSFLGFVLVSGFCLLCALMLLVLKKELNTAAQAAAGKEGKPGAAAKPAPRPIPEARPSARVSLSLRPFLAFSALVAAGVFISGFLFFFMVPRVGRGLFSWTTRNPNRVSGFSETVEFGSLGRLKLSNALVMRVKLDPFPQGASYLYFRGNALNYFDGTKWTDTRWVKMTHYFAPRQVVTLRPFSSLRRTVKQEIILEPVESSILFAMPVAAAVSAPWKFRVILEYHNDYIGLPLDSPIYDRVLYTAWSVPPKTTPAECKAAWNPESPKIPWEVKGYYLQLPRGMEELETLARRVTRGLDSPCDKVFRIKEYLQENYEYSLETSGSAGTSPVLDFLFNTRRGYCEHFATAAALMLRALRIPARIAAGYLAPAERNPIDDYITVREKDAHTWVEVYLPGGEWMLLDPTPPAAAQEEKPGFIGKWARNILEAIRYRWDRYVIDYSLQDQLRAARLAGQRSRAAGEALVRLPRNSYLLLRGALQSPLLYLAAALLFISYLAWTRQWLSRPGKSPARPGEVDPRLRREYLSLLALAEKRSEKRRPGQTIHEFAARLEQRGEPFAAAFRKATEDYARVRFGRKNAFLSRAMAEIARAKAEVKRKGRAK